MRLKRTYFSSKDQLLTLALATTLDPKMYVLAREVDVPAVQHLVGKNLGPTLVEIGRAGLRNIRLAHDLRKRLTAAKAKLDSLASGGH